MTPSMALGFATLSFVIIVAPGPSVLFVVSRAIVSGRRVALLTVLGNASGVFVQVLVLALGSGSLVTGSDAAYALLKTAGAAYLVWLGVHAIRHRHDAAVAGDVTAIAPTATPWRDGFVVGLTNPKSVVFLAALLPQYVDPRAGMIPAQMVALGAVFCAIAIVSDGAWAVLAARARTWLASDPRRLARSSLAGGLVMIALGLLLLTG